MRRVAEWYDQLIFKEYKISEEALGLYRIFFALASLFIIGYPSLTWMDQVSDFYYQPQALNIAYFLFHGIPSYSTLFLFSFVPFLCLIAILFGFKTRFFALAFGLLIMGGMSLKAGFGKIDHGLLYPLTAIIMAFSGWERKYSIRSKEAQKEHDGFPQFLVALVLALAMVGAGYSKWNGGWLEASNVGVLHYYVSSYFVWGREQLLAPYMIEIRFGLFWQLMDYATIAFEVLFLVAILNKKWLQAYLLLALVFHTGIFLILNITITNIFIVYALFLPWERFQENWSGFIFQPIRRLNKRSILLLIIFGSLLLTGTLYFIYATEEETTVALLNCILSPLEVDYRMWQTGLVYGLAYLILLGMLIRKTRQT